jgi:hypothetical protein
MQKSFEMKKFGFGENNLEFDLSEVLSGSFSLAPMPAFYLE